MDLHTVARIELESLVGLQCFFPSLGPLFLKILTLASLAELSDRTQSKHVLFVKFGYLTVLRTFRGMFTIRSVMRWWNKRT